ncbi:GNAT family N-acetyltransferase [Rossellomorea aquimaris]|uniref:GNAT family N-acetyltransferase n=1 Tax=Rossellomorea aquimaris TaxID=189382 RepID=UPI0007D07A03|nr:GNAT family N-acetyltransferase [Rossellomorea aquimaris]
MKIKSKEFNVRNVRYIVRSADKNDAKALSQVRLQVDGETENLDREKGENYIDESGFKQVIENDTDSMTNLFIVAEVGSRIVGFARCEGNKLKRSAHKVEFGVCVLKEFWGYGIGRTLLNESVSWADGNEIKKITLKVLETNRKAIELYEGCGFEVEGILKQDKLLSDGNYYNTILMGRL